MIEIVGTIGIVFGLFTGVMCVTVLHIIDELRRIATALEKRNDR